MNISVRIAIRAANLPDAPAIAQLARETWLNAYAGIVSSAQIEFMLTERYALDRLRQEMSDPQKWIDLAFCGEQLMGFSACEVCSGEYKLDKLYIHPDWQRQGAGGLLVHHAAARARSLAYPALILAVNKQNKKAIAAYEKLGFTLRGERSLDIGHGFVMDDYILEKTTRGQ